MAWQVYALYGLYLGGKAVYSYFHKEPAEEPKPEEIKLPRVDEGAPIPLVYGRTLVRAPICAYAGNLEAITTEAGPSYRGKFYFAAGIPFRDGTNRLHAIYAGETRLLGRDEDDVVGGGAMSLMTGDGNYEAGEATGSDGVRAGVEPDTNTLDVGGYVEFLNGNHLQLLVEEDSPYTPLTLAGEMMGPTPSQGWPGEAAAWSIPGYRGVLGVWLFGRTQTPGPSLPAARTGWRLGGPSAPAFGFEVSTYPAGFSTTNGIGLEVNPVAVIEDILTGLPGHGKLGLSSSLIDATSFAAAAQTLKDEGNGYSRCIDGRTDALEVINEILDQIDGVLYEDLSNGTEDSIKIKLIRGDYTPSSLPHITQAFGGRIENFSIATLTDAINKVRVVFTDRDNDYADNSATASDDAGINAVDGRVNEAVLRYPGVCTKELAEVIAARELAARATPLARCRAIVDRTFLRVNPGDAIKVTWPEYGLSSRIFRVINVDRGTLANGAITLDLVEDFFVVRRGIVLPGGEVTPFPVPDLPLSGG